MTHRFPECDNKEARVRNIGFLITLLLLVALIPLASKFYQSFQVKKTHYQEKLQEEQRLQKEVERLEQRTKELHSTADYLQTNQGVEKVARDKLGLTKPNEIPMVVRRRSNTPVYEVVSKPADREKKDETGKKPDKD